MGRLEDLMEQKKAIEKEIKELKEQAIFNGRARYDVEHYPTSKEDDYLIMVKTNAKRDNGYSKKPIWRSIVRTPRKEDVLPQLSQVIEDLTGLRDRLKELIGE